jgi:hypothetical protein
MTLVGSAVLVAGILQTQILLPSNSNSGTPLMDRGAKVGNFLYSIFSFNIKNLYSRAKQKLFNKSNKLVSLGKYYDKYK